ncbi:MAG: hypothetical protein LBP79_07705 [Clostridiales bacterium]|nr:hypothetical protein [Clostridiales bacterium]
MASLIFSVTVLTTDAAVCATVWTTATTACVTAAVVLTALTNFENKPTFSIA